MEQNFFFFSGGTKLVARVSFTPTKRAVQQQYSGRHMSKQAKLKDFFTKQNSSEEKDGDETEIPEAAADDVLPPAEKKRKSRSFRTEWMEKYPWLRCEVMDGTEKMFCSHCEKSGKKNGFTRGSTNMRSSSLIEHSQCSDHIT